MMKQLLYKELSLSINKFFYILPILLGALFFIPNWIYLLVFMYFFWISVPQIFAAYNDTKDYQFMALLPVRKKDIVTSKVYSILIIEAIHILAAAVFAVLHNFIYQYGAWNIFFDVNYALFGVAILMFAVFNLTFLPLYFKTAHFFGKPTIYGTIIALVYGFIFEFGVIRFQFMRDIFEGSLVSQLVVLGVTLVLAIGVNWFTLKRSQDNFLKIDL